MVVSAKMTLGQVLAVGRGGEDVQHHAGAALLHERLAHPHVERAGLAQRVGGVREQLGRHVVDVGLEDDVVAGAVAAGGGCGDGLERRGVAGRVGRRGVRVHQDRAQHVGPAGDLAAAGPVPDALDAAARQRRRTRRRSAPAGRRPSGW